MKEGTELKEGQQAIAIIDLSTSTLHILNVPDEWDAEKTEDWLGEQGYHLSNCSWGAFDGVINDGR